MKILFAVASLFFLTFSDLPAQFLNSANQRTDISKPTVYITAEKSGNDSEIRLIAHNNTMWAIRLCLKGSTKSGQTVKTYSLRLSDGKYVTGLINGEEYPACYGVEPVPAEYGRDKTAIGPIAHDLGHVFSHAWLSPGKSAVFVVPRIFLGKGLSVYLTFNYEWERENTDPEEGEIRKDEPQHRVYFYSSSLSPNL